MYQHIYPLQNKTVNNYYGKRILIMMLLLYFKMDLMADLNYLLYHLNLIIFMLWYIHTFGKGLMTKYNFAIVSRTSILIQGPVLPPPHVVFPQDEEFRQFLLTKFINTQRATYFASSFAENRPRRLWLLELLEKYSDK